VPVGELLSAQGDYDGFKPIHVSAIAGTISLSKLLIESGWSNLDEPALNEAAQTPLYLAFLNDQEKMTEFLVEMGANVNQTMEVKSLITNLINYELKIKHMKYLPYV